MTTEMISEKAFSDRDLLTADNLAARTKGLPFRARMVLRGLLGLQAGTLAMTIPGGQTFVIAGRQPGPHATVTLHNWNLMHRAVTGGAIGVAETYMDGDWDSPDAGAFL